jgi:hypothetical protein
MPASARRRGQVDDRRVGARPQQRHRQAHAVELPGEAVTKSLSRELGADGIRVNAVLPGIVAGDRQRRVLEGPEMVLPRAEARKRIWSASWRAVTYSLIEAAEKALRARQDHLGPGARGGWRPADADVIGRARGLPIGDEGRGRTAPDLAGGRPVGDVRRRGGRVPGALVAVSRFVA